jgi:hypothetical protein
MNWRQANEADNFCRQTQSLRDLPEDANVPPMPTPKRPVPNFAQWLAGLELPPTPLGIHNLLRLRSGWPALGGLRTAEVLFDLQMLPALLNNALYHPADGNDDFGLLRFAAIGVSCFVYSDSQHADQRRISALDTHLRQNPKVGFAVAKVISLNAKQLPPHFGEVTAQRYATLVVLQPANEGDDKTNRVCVFLLGL